MYILQVYLNNIYHKCFGIQHKGPTKCIVGVPMHRDDAPCLVPNAERSGCLYRHVGVLNLSFR